LLGNTSSSSNVIDNKSNEIDLSWLDNIWGDVNDLHRGTLGDGY
jgi:hypothetical protein